MKFISHHAGAALRVVALTIGIVLLASCGSTDSTTVGTTATDGTTTVEPTATDTATGTATGTATDSAAYTINAGDTLSGIAGRAGVSVADIVTVNGWADGSDHLIVPGDVIKLPAGSAAVSPQSTSPAAPATPATPATVAPGATPSTGGYTLTEDKVFSSLSANQKTDPILSPLPDGQYWSWDYTSDGENVSFTLVQYFYGDACAEQFGDDCASDNNTLYTPTATVKLTDGAATSIIVCCGADGGGGFASYRVSRSEFAHLVAGRGAASDAPANFSYARYGVIVTVQNGQATAADQVFTS